MFTRATTYNIIDRTYHGGGAKFDCFLFSFFFTLLKTPRGVRATGLNASFAGARLAFVASDGDPRTKNVVPTNPSLVADLTYCREAMWCRGNIRMGRYSGCVDRPIADRAPAWLQPIVEGAFAASLAGLRSCLREGACAISGMRYIAARRSRGGSSSSRVLTRGIR